MQFPKGTIEEIVESERLRLLSAEERYGKFYAHTRGVSVFLSLCVDAIDPDRMMFGRFHAHMKKHHMLALFSTLRLHKVQAMMNLRQVLEAGGSAALPISDPQKNQFLGIYQPDLLAPSHELTQKSDARLPKNNKKKSGGI